MAYKDLNGIDRVRVVHLDFMRNATFCRLSGFTQIGEVHVNNKVPTAATNGADVIYNEAWILTLTQKQLRYLVAHENLHKALHHCTGYVELCKKYPQLAGQAMDYVVNQIIEDMDAGTNFVERPTNPGPLIDAKYKDWSWIDVLEDLLKNPPQGGGGGSGDGSAGQQLDEHTQVEVKPKGDGEDEAGNGDGKTLTEEQLAQLKQAIEDARVHGEMVAKRLAGKGSPGVNLAGFKERKTDYVQALREFFLETIQGDDLSRLIPPNKRMLASGFLMPSHYTEAVGELIIACDTSASMSGIYPVVFGEIARLCQQVTPAAVRLLWWDVRIQGDQRFEPKDYHNLRNAMKPRGGGGTIVSCVAQYVAEKGYKPQAVIYMTDGYIESDYKVVDRPSLWVITDNPGFKPRKGKLLRLRASEVS